MVSKNGWIGCSVDRTHKHMHRKQCDEINDLFAKCMIFLCEKKKKIESIFPNAFMKKQLSINYRTLSLFFVIFDVSNYQFDWKQNPSISHFFFSRFQFQLCVTPLRWIFFDITINCEQNWIVFVNNFPGKLRNGTPFLF